MAKNDNEKQQIKINRKTNKLVAFVQDNLNKLYTSTYYSQPSNKQSLYDIKTKLDMSIDNIITDNKSNTGISNLSTLYSRIHKEDPTSTPMNKDLETLLNDNNVLDSGMLGFINDTTNIYDYDNKIDTIIKYMPKLNEALECRKDNVLSADHFSKDFINVNNETCSVDPASSAEHIKEIKERYNFLDLADDIYSTASKYGEQFVYIVPSKKAISKLLSTKKDAAVRSDINTNECAIITESGIIDMTPNFSDGITQKDLKESNINITLEFDKSCMIKEAIEGAVKYSENITAINEMALTESKIVNFAGSNKNGKKKKRKGFVDTIPDDLSFDNFDYEGNDGLVNLEKQKKKANSVNIPGSIVKLLDRKRVIPIYIESHCFGYYYVEVDGQYNPVGDKMNDPTMALKGSNSILQTNSPADQSSKQENILRYLASQISSQIDSEFVNLNQDLRDEIYMILKYNEMNNMNRMNKVKVTFIPPEDIEHVYFKMNKDTHRGISDLNEALFPATLYSAMYITNCIMTMTRSQDKRVYYVKQNVDTNISKTLLSTIDQIKKSNMNIRQIENINHIMSITGRFNDYVIPKNASGESPIDMEVLQGQSVEFKTELMTVLEEMAINSTDVPMEMIQMRQSVDYASQLTMSSSKFLRKVYNRQAKYQNNLTRIFNKLYQNEFNDNVQLLVKLPPPMFLNITNTNQMVMNVKDFTSSISEIMLNIDDDKIKQEVTRDLNLQYLGSYLDIDAINETITKAKQKASKDKEMDNIESE